MSQLPFILEKKYQDYLKNKQITDYIRAICEDGIRWWFNMNTPSIIVHLTPLTTFGLEKDNLPPRLVFLMEATKQTISHEVMERLYHHFAQSGDIEAMAASIGAGVSSIWDSGREFSRYRPWLERIESLMSKRDSMSPLACASLIGFKGLIELTGLDINKAYKTYMRQRVCAELAGSLDLMVYFASACSYSLIWMGKLKEADVVISDAEVLCERPEVNVAVKTYFQSTRGLYYYVTGKVERAEAILKGIIEQPYFEDLPPPAYFLTYGHLLLTLAKLGKKEELEGVARKLRERAVPENNYFHLSYLHYNLGTAYLLLGDPQRALIHANEAIERAHLSESPVAPNIPALLYGQALSDMGMYEEALKHMRDSLSKWTDNGFYLLATTGCVEMANIYLKMGMIERARSYLEQAESMIEGDSLPMINRENAFLKEIKMVIMPDDKCKGIMFDIDRRPVCIRTFGDLELKIGDTVLYDRKWKGGRTKSLLKALIVFGGTKVSYDALIDILWPETAGDVAEGNLKVALSRLRRVGCRDNEKPPQWILVKQRKVSLARPVCGVDCIVFKETIDRFLQGEEFEIEVIMKVLDLYRDDFLARDYSDTWIIRHRELLKENFVKAVIYLSKLCLKHANFSDASKYLNRAIEKDPLNEEIYASMMDVHLQSGYPSKAIQVYRQAEDILKRELDISPGPRLKELARQSGIKL